MTFTILSSKIRNKSRNVKIDGKIFFDEPINNDTKKYENIRKIATGQEMITQLVVY